MLIKKNDITEKMRTDAALSSKLTIDEIQDALIDFCHWVNFHSLTSFLFFR